MTVNIVALVIGALILTAGLYYLVRGKTTGIPGKYMAQSAGSALPDSWKHMALR